MKTFDLSEAKRLGIVTVDDHAQFRKSIRTPSDVADIDDDMIQIDPFNGDPPSKRSDKDLARTLAILDSIEERGNG